MSKPLKAQVPPEEAILAYKRILQEVLNQRPSGTRQRLADALGKNRSFVTQMTSPTYPTPIPHRHLATVLAVCHFTPEVRDAFMAAYRLAHPKRFELGESHSARHLNLLVPDFGDDKRNATFDKAVIEFVQRMAGLVGERGGDD
jgi:hypothetical protein